MAEDNTILIAVIVLLLTILAAVIIGNYFRKKTGEDTKQHLKENRQKSTSETVDALNAFDRVQKKGGKILYINKKKFNTYLINNPHNKTIKIKKPNPVVVLKNEETGEKEVVSRHEKKITADTILVNESEQTKSPKDEKKVVSRHELNHSTDTSVSESKEEKKDSEEK